MSKAQKRLGKEFQKIRKDPIPGATCNLKKNNVQHWGLVVGGPEKTPYESGKFKFFLNFPDQYPFKPPKVKSETRVYHPNFDNKKGDICGVEVLMEDNWKAAIGVREIVIGIQQLFREPGAGNPLDEDIFKVYQYNPRKFKKTAEEWTKKFAR